MTFALALTTLFCINYYGFKKKGLGGRLKRYFPNVMNFVSDIAAPVSLACRLFGNMLGGMIVMDLLYSAMGNAAIGFPSLAGLYFNLFHPLIQTYIFITLSLTFIGEAVE
jgi:F-type H+-transporting ATPase subunit a